MNLTENIRRELQRKRLSQAALARKMGKAPSTVHALVHGRGSPRLSTLERLAAVLDTTVGALVGGRSRRKRLGGDSEHERLVEGP
jgi:transcriptional regulator with XRE-family HTH domain